MGSALELMQEAGLASGERYDPDVAALAAEYPYAAASWAENGYNTVRLTPGLVAALDQTDVSRSLSDLRLPFGGMAVDISAFGAEWAQMEIGGHRMPLTFLLVAERAVADREWTIATRSWDRFSIVAWRCAVPELFLPPRMLAGEAMGDHRRETHKVQRVKRLVAATIAWLSAHRDATAWSKREGSRRREPRGKARPRVWVIGKGVNPHPGMVAAAKSSRTGARQELQSRHIVRGHYRRQPCGPGRKERKTIWVEPFWRGPDSEVAWAHIYTAKETA
jgi:hypothetical protein